MKIIVWIAVLALGFWGVRWLMVKGQQAEQQRRDNAAVRYAKTLQSSEQKAQGAVDTANKVIQQQERQANEAGEAGQ